MAAPTRPRSRPRTPQFPHARLQILAESAAQAQFLSALENHLVFARAIDLKCAHAAQVDDGRAMDAAKHVRIQVPLQLRHAPAQQVRFRPHVQAHIVIRRFHPIDVGYSHIHLVPGAAHREPRCLRRAKSAGQCRLARNQSLFGTLQRQSKARLIDGFEQIVERAGIEGPQRVLIVCRDENDDRQRAVRLENLQDVESAALRHLHIEKHQVRPRAANRGDCLGARARFRD